MSAVHVRVKDATKKSAQKVFKKMGIDLSTGINLYLHQVILTQSIPFPLLTENGLTHQQEEEILQAEKEAMRGINVSGPFSAKEEIQAHLDSLK
jgi:DNA-damage-inducible protein J